MRGKKVNLSFTLVPREAARVSPRVPSILFDVTRKHEGIPALPAGLNGFAGMFE